MEDRQEQVTVVDSHTAHRHIRNAGIYATAIGTVLFLGVAGYSLFLLHAYFIYLGYALFGGAFIVLLCVIAFPVVALIRYATHGTFYDVGSSGGYYKTPLGRMQPLPPMTAIGAKTIAEKKRIVDVTPVVPTITDLIESGDIRQGSLEMVMGYDAMALRKSILELVKGPWPGTHAVAGKGRSGKTRRVVAEIAQALIAGAKVTICDPHSTKRDSLVNELKPLEPWLHIIAHNEEEVIEASREFFTEMESRVDRVSLEVIGYVDDDPDKPIYTPRLIVYDEWPRLMTTSRIEDEDREIMITTAENCSKEYAGYDGFCCLIGQAWTLASCGSTDIRRLLFDAFIHNLNAEFASFFFRQKKWQNRAEELKSRECLYKNYSGEVREIITIGVPDDAAIKVAEYLMRVSPPEKRQELPGSEQVQQIAPRDKSTGPLADVPLLNMPTSQVAAASHSQKNELETVICLPETAREVGGKSAGSGTGNDERVSDEAFVKVLREIGKRLKEGESPVEIRKSLGINGGRALQEVNSALNWLQETSMEGN